MGKKSRTKKLRRDAIAISVKFLGDATPDGVFSYWGCKLERQKAIIVARSPERAIARFLEVHHLLSEGGKDYEL
jgi:hypothetical protein